VNESKHELVSSWKTWTIKMWTSQCLKTPSRILCKTCQILQRKHINMYCTGTFSACIDKLILMIVGCDYGDKVPSLCAEMKTVTELDCDVYGTLCCKSCIRKIKTLSSCSNCLYSLNVLFMNFILILVFKDPWQSFA
jgi:hypothetical protein